MIYQTTVNYPNSEVISENETEFNCWNRATKAFFALMQMLPSYLYYTTLEEKCITFKPLNTTIAEIISKNNKIRLPYIIATGSTRSTITHYNFIIDQSSISC